MFYRILEKAQFRRIRFHDLRHTSASLLTQQAESLSYVRDQLGTNRFRSPRTCTGIRCPGEIDPRSIAPMTRNYCNPRATSR